MRSDLSDPIYLDFNASTPVDGRVLEAMIPYFVEASGNASSAHAAGRRAAQGVDLGRSQVAESVGAGTGSIVFTSGATEADSLAINGVWQASTDPMRRRIVTVATEHHAVVESIRALAPLGADVVVLGVDRQGAIDLDELAETLRVPTLLVSVMAANNETGAMSDLRAIGRIAHEAGAVVHADAAQVLGKVAFSVTETDVDLASLSAHKAHGPKGVGALFVRPGVRIIPQLRGGGQERDLRSGTSNVPGIVGFGVAATIAASAVNEQASRMNAARDALWRALSVAIPGIVCNAPLRTGLPNTLSVRLPSGDAEDVLLATPEVAAATGSACNSGSPEPSHVLMAMGLTRDEARASIRFSVGRTTTSTEVELAATALGAGYRRVTGQQ
jgi:cysteine desulfurase